MEENLKLRSLIGDRSANALSKHLGLSTVGELLHHFPRRYASRGELTPFGSLTAGEMVTVVGEVHSLKVRHLKGRSGSVLEIQLTDGGDRLELAFFNQAWRQKELYPGVRGLFSGRVTQFGSKLQLAHPDYELFSEVPSEFAKSWAERPIPIYPAAGSISTWKIQKAIEILLDQLELEDPFPELLELGHIDYRRAMNQIHRPKLRTDIAAAVSRLKMQEAITLRLRLNQLREASESLPAKARTPGALLDSFDSQLGFRLTDGQSAASNEILTDLAKTYPMNRLLQGEVGSGKTLVAIRALLAVAESGGQTAFLAPTEVLAFQHYQAMIAQLGDIASKLGVAFVSGSLPKNQRRQIELDVASGKIQVVVGTHALLSEKLIFRDLGLAIIDEQHRFGVEQRQLLRKKSEQNPHVLAMTATPIPRTVAVAAFGDLQISTLRELPQGRKPIKSHVVPVNNPGLVARVWERAAEEIEQGRQVFVVCPKISSVLSELDEPTGDEDSPSGDVEPANVEDVAKSLSANPLLTKARVSTLHGKLDPEDKADVMRRFSQGHVDIIVSTTVIEVGVNVPNATLMVVLDADRFGIAQLHQLRGRVGRGEHAGLFLMMSTCEPGSPALERLETVARTTDGFELSDYDLQVRGEGDVLGRIQSGGKSGLKILKAVQDEKLIEIAVGVADKIYSAGLSTERRIMLHSLGDIGVDQS